MNKHLPQLSVGNPNLMSQWHPFLNVGITTSDVTLGSHRKIWWRCERNHEWIASVNDRNNGSGCPYCSGNKVCVDNCLSTTNPEISKEWNLVRNMGLTPDKVTPYANKKVWWKCKNGHEWKAQISNRSNGSGCPKCSGCGISDTEVRVFTELEEFFGGVLHSERIEGKEVDVFIPDIKTGIEVDGYHWHRNGEKRDLAKTEFLKSRGVKVVRFREFPLCRLSSEDIIYRQKNLHSAIADLIDLIANVKRVDSSWYRSCGIFIGNDRYLLKLASIYPKEHRSLDKLFPKIALGWHPSKNGDLSPSNVSYGSNKKVWWKCERGHEWEAMVLKRSYGRGCPYCCGRKTSNENCLLNRNPQLSTEWHPSKNGGMMPADVTAFSNKKFWWKCINGHEWEAVVADRMRGNKCPHCYYLKAGHKVENEKE